MLFNSAEFLLFFALVYFIYLHLGHKWQNRFLLLASFVFYGSWNWRFLGLLIFSIVLDYNVGLQIAKAQEQRSKKRWLFLSIAGNLGLLAFFKYFNFFQENLVELFRYLGFESDGFYLQIILPIGISFYTFQTMSYTIDIYRGKLTPCKNIFDFALFVTFFPQLIAGPIARAADLLPQITRPRTISPTQLESGLFLIIFGLFKKVIIADGCAYVVTAVFSGGDVYTGLDRLIAVYAFAFQIYGDFSGYSNIARGLMKVMGFELVINFNLPYFATNPSDFWRRWHISLSTWLRDYLYISLGGSFGAKWLTYRNLFLTMLLGGIWHGASWTMVLWGIYQGVILIIHRLFTGDKTRHKEHKKPLWLRIVQIVFMFQVTCLGWLIFRAESVSQIGVFLGSIFSDLSPSAMTLGYCKLLLLLVIPLLLFQMEQYRQKTLDLLLLWNSATRAAFFLGLIWIAGIHFALHRSLIQGEIPFIYFQF